MTTLNVPTYGNQYRKANNHFEELKAIAQEIPNRTLKVNPGLYWRGKYLIEFKGSNTPGFENPPSPNHAKFDIVAIDEYNKVVILEGDQSDIQAELPDVPEDYLPLAAVYLKNNTISISDSMIFDLRPYLNIKSLNLDHSCTLNRNSPDQHSISSITDLETKLNQKADKLSFDNFVLSTNTSLNYRSHVEGTDSTEFHLNRTYTGVPSSDCYFSVNRGSLTNVAIRWNEAENQWQYTNDGVSWIPFNNSVNNSSPATDGALGLVRLSNVSPTPTTPTVVETNDSRLLTDSEKSLVLNHVSNSVTSVSGKTGVVNLNKVDVGLDQLDNTSDLNKPVSIAMQLALNAKVDKEAGKKLSSEDFTTYEKNKLASVEQNAQENTVVTVAGKNGNVVLDKADVGLGQLDNTSDLNKPISNAVQLELDSLATKYVSATIPNDHILLKDKVVAGRFYRIEVHNGVVVATLI